MAYTMTAQYDRSATPGDIWAEGDFSIDMHKDMLVSFSFLVYDFLYRGLNYLVIQVDIKQNTVMFPVGNMYPHLWGHMGRG